MSVDLDWLSLSSLAPRVVEALNRQLSNTQRPSFIGPITVHSVEFGQTAPDVELVDVREIYPDFLEDAEDYGKSDDGVSGVAAGDTDEDYQWVPRNAVGRGAASDIGQAHHVLSPHPRPGRTSPLSSLGSTDFLSRPPPLGSIYPRHAWGRTSLPNLGELGGSQALPTSRSYDYLNAPGSRGGNPKKPSFRLEESRHGSQDGLTNSPLSRIHEKIEEENDNESNNPPEDDFDETINDVQLHFRILHHADIRVALSTSLLLNYPSPLFMALPVKLSIVGIELNAEVVVAYQASKKRIHLCILDDQDPFAPITAASKRSDPNSTEVEDNKQQNESKPIGLRLLPNIHIESEIGQTDKHVLRNVSRVEKFIQDMIRKTLVEELVFPNFHTIIYGD